jgi:tetratricopeptide (TPR) repeat protein
MKPKFYTILFLSLVFLASSCKTAGKAYQKGDYEEAVYLAAKKIQKDPGNKDLIATIRNAYRLTVEDHEHKIKNISSRNDELKWERMLYEYYTLQNLYDALRKSPEAFELVNPTDYSSYISTYRDKSAEIYVERGERHMSKNDRNSFKQAYYEFQKALRHKPGDWHINEKKQAAYEAAVVHVVILPPNRYGYRSSFSSNSGFGFENELLRSLRNQFNNNFVKFYSDWDIRSTKAEPDQVIELNYSNMNVGRVYDNKSTREVSKEIVTKEIVYKPDSIVKQTSRVTALITTTRRTINSDGNMNVTIRNEKGRIIWADNIRGDHQWHTVFSSYTGDSRALSDEDKRILNQREEMPPHADQISNAITNEIMNNMVYRLRDFYSRY